MRVLVCGGRDYSDRETAFARLDALHERDGVTILIEGGAKGADRIGREWALSRKVHFATVPAHWDSFGRAAGHARNRAMLDLLPEYCVAFPGGTGTAGMVKLCKERRVVVWEVPPCP